MTQFVANNCVTPNLWGDFEGFLGEESPLTVTDLDKTLWSSWLLQMLSSELHKSCTNRWGQKVHDCL